jgi:LysR family transcriptional regulator, low CO2-responsive transcriptional regulator
MIYFDEYHSFLTMIKGADMRATWNQLRIFEAVARRNSFTRAAEELSVVQPTISAQIKLLADSVGMPLFEQVGKKLYLTEAGRILYATCLALFDTWARFEMAAADLQGVKKGTLRIAIVSTAKYFVPRMLGPFCKRYPDIDVALEIANRDSIVERLKNNRDDLYIMGVPPDKFPVERHPFLENPLVVIAPRDHELAQRKKIPLTRLQQERFISREKGSGTRITTDDFLAARDIQLNIKMELSNNEAIKWSVAGGMGLAVLSQHALLLEPMGDKLAVLNVQGFPIHAAWYVVTPAGKQLSVLAQTFFDYLKQEAALLQKELHAASRK